MKRTPLRKVSKKRAVQNKKYMTLREKFLKAHPYCMACIKFYGLDEDQVIKSGGYVYGSIASLCPTYVPPSSEIHHVARRVGEKLIQVDKWLAVSRDWHRKIHDDPKWARKHGLLE